MTRTATPAFHGGASGAPRAGAQAPSDRAITSTAPRMPHSSSRQPPAAAQAPLQAHDANEQPEHGQHERRRPVAPARPVGPLLLPLARYVPAGLVLGQRRQV